MASALRNMSGTIRVAALADGQNVLRAATYVNYARFGIPLEDVPVYGGNLERLRNIKAAVDPEDVMGLAGGTISRSTDLIIQCNHNRLDS